MRFSTHNASGLIGVSLFQDVACVSETRSPRWRCSCSLRRCCKGSTSAWWMKTIPQAQRGYMGSHYPLTSMNCLLLEREGISTHQYPFRFAGDCSNNQVTGKIIRGSSFVIRDSRSTISTHNTITTCTYYTFYVKQQAVFNVSAMLIMFITIVYYA